MTNKTVGDLNQINTPLNADWYYTEQSDTSYKISYSNLKTAITIDLIPSQTGNAGKYLGTNGSTTAWSSVGSVTSVSVTPSGGLTGVVTNPTTTPTILFTQVKQGNVFITGPINTTIPLMSSAQYAFTLNGLSNLKVSGGTITATIQINGVNVTGLSNLSVTSTPQSPTASAANTVAIGDRVTLVLTSNSSAADLEFTWKGTN